MVVREGHRTPPRMRDAGRKAILVLLGGLTAIVLSYLLSVMGIRIVAGGIEGEASGHNKAEASSPDDGEYVDVIDSVVGRCFNASNYTFATVPEYKGFNVDKVMKTSLEFLRDVPAVFDYTREEKIRESHQLKADGTEPPVRVACLYAGFMRDFEKMFMTCGDEKKTHPNFCKHPKRRKFFGRQRDNILKALDCDVFMSTWNIRGAGRFNTVLYDMNKTVKEGHVKGVYGVRMARLHVQDYAPYQPLWKWMGSFLRNFPQVHPTVGGVDVRGQLNWTGVAETNPFVRINDYSQSYKQWCALQLVNRFSLHYDLYFRLRTDLRSTHKFQHIHFHNSEDEDEEEMLEDLSRVPRAWWDTTSKFALAATCKPDETAAPAFAPPGGAPANYLSSPVPEPEIPNEALALNFEYNRSRMIYFQLLKVEDKEQRFCGKRDKRMEKMRRRSQAEKEAKEEERQEEGGDDNAGNDDHHHKHSHGKKGQRGGPKKCDNTIKQNLATNHSVGEGRIHVNDFGVGDFGFMGTPTMVTELGKLWYYCIAPSTQRSTYPVEHEDVSEYNLMLWHIVFTKKWLVDSGGRYLWVSRRGNMEAKKLQGGANVVRTVKGPGITLKSGGGMKVVVRRVKKKM